MKTILTLLVLGLLLTIETVSAVPANPEPFTMVQQDNSSIQVIQVGDENGAHFETPDGYSIVQDEGDKWWKYAKKDKKGKLVSTEHKVGHANPEKSGLEKHSHPDIDEQGSEVEKTKGQASLVSSAGSSASSQIPAPAFAPQLGAKKTLVILINFTDTAQSPSHTPSFYDDLLFSGVNSMNNYYKEVSYNNITITGAIAGNRWFNTSNNTAWYGHDITGIDANGNDPDFNNRYIFKLAKEAVIAADPYVDYSQYDSNGDGIIDHLIIVHAGNGQESSGNTNDIWSHSWDIYVYTNTTGWSLGYMTADGVKAVGYTMQAEGSPMGTFAHEFGHDLGLPDLYDTDSSSDGVGNWDIMAYGSWLNGGNTPAHFSAWSKYFLGWVNPAKVTHPLLNENINAVETNDDVYMLLDNPGDSPGNLDWTSNGTGEYFLVENRRKTGYDAYLPGEGLLIWHINESRKNNSIDNRRLVDLEEADGLNHLDVYGGNQGDANDPWYSKITGFTDSSTPNSRYYNGSASGVSVNNISASGAVMTADLIVPGLIGQNTVVQSTNSTFGTLLKGQAKTINYSIILSNTGDIPARVEAHFSNSVGGVFGLISGANILGAANFSLGLPGALVPLNNTGADVQVAVAPLGVTVLEARLDVPAGQNAGGYSGIVVLTFSNNV